MKYLLFLILPITPLNFIHAQDGALTRNADGIFEYQEVIEVSGNADQLYARALNWITLNYKSAQDVIQLNDPENHKIIVKGYFSTTNFTQPVFIRHTLTIETREGRYRVTYGPFIYQGGVNAPEILFEDRVPNGKKMRNFTFEKIQESLETLNITMKKNEEDW